MIKFITLLSITLLLLLIQQVQANKFTIHFEYRDIASHALKSPLEQLCKVSGKYFSDLIQVADPVSTQQRQFQNVFSNSGHTYLASDQSTGFPNCHLVIFVSVVNQPSEGFIAYAGGLEETAQKRPTFGQVVVNEANFSVEGDDTNAQFEYNLETIIHEILHILRFNGVDYLSNGQYETVNGQNRIKSPEVLAWAKNYFGEPVDYVPFENEGGSGSKGAHWERMALQNDVMSASAIQSDAAISGATLAFLADTGIYQNINMEMAEDCIKWGANKGFEFLTNTDCGAGKNWREFSDTQQKDQCDYYHFGYGPSQIASFSNGCYVQKIYSNTDCTNPANKPEGEQHYQTYGTNSKCFMSTINDGWQDYKCYQYYCTRKNEVVIQLMQDASTEFSTVVCTENGQTIQAPGLSGELTCPENLADFCHYPIPCKNYCSQNGYCLRKDVHEPFSGKDSVLRSKCYCIDGYEGEDCSQNTCISQNKKMVQNKDICVDNCDVGYHYDESINMCVFDKCDDACYNINKICDGPTSSDCIECPENRVFVDNECVSFCPKDTVSLDGRTCTDCPDFNCLVYNQAFVSGEEAMIKYNDQAKYICPAPFQENEAHVFCKEQGFGTFESISIGDCSDPSKGYWVSGLSCTGTEASLDECQKTITGSCSLNQCVKISCKDSAPKNYDVRNSNAKTLMFYSGSYGSICSPVNPPDSKYANTVCKSMGKDQAKNIEVYSQCLNNVLISELNCQGEESHIRYCNSYPSSSSKYEGGVCDPGSCLYVTCEDSAFNPAKYLDKIDGMYLVLAYILGSALVITFASLCILKRCSSGEYEVKIDYAEANKTDVGKENDEEDFHKEKK